MDFIVSADFSRVYSNNGSTLNMFSLPVSKNQFIRSNSSQHTMGLSDRMIGNRAKAGIQASALQAGLQASILYETDRFPAERLIEAVSRIQKGIDTDFISIQVYLKISSVTFR